MSSIAEAGAGAGSGARVSRRPGVIGVLLALAFMAGSLALNWPYAREGFQADDLLFVNILRQDPLPFSRWRGAWSAPIEGCPSFRTLWWFEDGAVGSFWRPVPSLAFEGSLRLFGDNALPLHLLSILLHGLVAFTGACFLARLTERRRIALLAGVLYLLCPHHGTAVGWISAGSEVMCVLFLNLAFIAHLRWREARRPAWLAVSLGLLVLALASKESAVAGPAGVVLLEWFLARLEAPGWRARARAWRRAAVIWAPACLLLVAYLAAYRVLGLGGMENLDYTDPFRHPVAFITQAAARLPALLSALLSLLPPSTALFVPASVAFFVVAGAALFVLWLPAVRSVLRGPADGWVLAYVLVTLLPQLATDAHERLLYYPLVLATYL
ncbi:MAG TPA: hypothetical protein VF832_19790, partial [Longimicrobiales bacterium]